MLNKLTIKQNLNVSVTGGCDSKKNWLSKRVFICCFVFLFRQSRPDAIPDLRRRRHPRLREHAARPSQPRQPQQPEGVSDQNVNFHFIYLISCFFDVLLF
jgi:hypothetical protein